jgi:hypothetical protein
MSAPTAGRRVALAALPLALAGTAAGSAAPSPIMGHALRVSALYEREQQACEAIEAAEGTPAEPAAQEALGAAYDAWAAGMNHLATMPASTAHDVLTKLALALWALRDGPAPPERALGTSVMHDLWRLFPELRLLLRWTPEDAPSGPPGGIFAREGENPRPGL